MAHSWAYFTQRLFLTPCFFLTLSTNSQVVLSDHHCQGKGTYEHQNVTFSNSRRSLTCFLYACLPQHLTSNQDLRLKITSTQLLLTTPLGIHFCDPICLTSLRFESNYSALFPSVHRPPGLTKSLQTSPQIVPLVSNISLAYLCPSGCFHRHILQMILGL